MTAPGPPERWKPFSVGMILRVVPAAEADALGLPSTRTFQPDGVCAATPTPSTAISATSKARRSIASLLELRVPDMISLRRSRTTVPTETFSEASRRRFLGSVTSGILSAIGGILAFLGGGAVLSSTGRRQEDWLAVSALPDLPDNHPTPAPPSVTRMDRYLPA